MYYIFIENLKTTGFQITTLQDTAQYSVVIELKAYPRIIDLITYNSDNLLFIVIKV